MKILKTYQVFNESKEQKERIYEYGCCLLNFDFPEMEEIQHMIDPDDIYNDPDNPSRFGLEDKPHVTLLYGFNDGGDNKYLDKSQVDKILDISSSIDGEILLTNLSIFANDNYDVLKFEAECEELNRINKDLMDNFDYTTDFPDYKPHCTIAYLKPGTGKKYINRIKKDFNVIPKEIVYSRPNIEGDKKEEFRKKIEIDQ
jgi:2'-5' RNA ligase